VAAYKDKDWVKVYFIQEKLFGEEDINLHHIIPRKDGGHYSLTNIAPLHKTCHENITYTKNPGNLFPGRT
jgi:5-methylcytosine-specific restriction endonuclease McrA